MRNPATGSAATFAPDVSWSPRRRQGSRPAAATAACPACAVRKSPCSPESAPTTTCAWNAAATRTLTSGPRITRARPAARRHRTDVSPRPVGSTPQGTAPQAARTRAAAGARTPRPPSDPRVHRRARVRCPGLQLHGHRALPRLRPGLNRLRSLLLDPEEQAFHQDWTKATADFIAALRTTIGDDTDNPRFVELVGELALSSQRFRTLWARHDVRSLDGGTTTVHHPVVGELRLHRDKLPIDDVILVVYYPDKDSDSDEKLQLLAALSHTEPTDTAQQVNRGEGPPA